MYNENGLRVQKTATTTGATKYTLHGKNIVHMTQGNNELHFFYDAQNKPAVVFYNGTLYSYMKNLQGDIVAILDSNKNVVVSYVYDAWGRPISKTGSMAATLGTVQPFRYRGYVYDEETELYYLRSRYYNSHNCRLANADALLILSAISTEQNQYCYAFNSPLLFGDDAGTLPRGFFHSAVLADIVKKDAALIWKDTTIDYIGGKYGFADLIDPTTGEVWELKRVTIPNIDEAISQLKKYTQETNATWRYAAEYDSSYTQLHRGGYRSTLYGVVYEGTYIGVYAYVGDGIIIYDYVNITTLTSIHMLENMARKIFNRMENRSPVLLPDTGQITIIPPRHSHPPLPPEYRTNESSSSRGWGAALACIGVGLAMFCCYGASKHNMLGGTI